MGRDRVLRIVGRWLLLMVILGSTLGLVAQENATLPGELHGDSTKDELRRLLLEDQTAIEAPRPGPFTYMYDAGRHVTELFFSWLSGHFTNIGGWVAQVVTYGTRILLVVLSIALVVLTVRHLRRQQGSAMPKIVGSPEQPRPERLGVEHWRRELLARLEAQDGAGALKALWWWWACVLEARDVDPSWTTRELLQATGRRDLRPVGRHFDFLAYGTDRVSVAEVRGLWGEGAGFRATGRARGGFVSRIRWIIMVGTLVGAFFWALSSVSSHAASSMLSRGADGWHGVRVAMGLWDLEPVLKKAPWQEALEPEQEDAEPGVLVLTFPWQKPMQADEKQALHRFLRRGGTVIVGYSGGAATPSEFQVLELLGMGELQRLRDGPPLSPMAWWRYRTERWSPEALDGGAALELAAFDYAPEPPKDAQIQYRLRTEVDKALVYEYPWLGGRVVVVPAALWSNSELLNADNLALLEELVARFDGRPWWVDEYHHGLVRADLVRESAANISWDAFMVHLGVIYCLVVWALGRRFGPVWKEPMVRLGSTAEFLENLGGLHHRLGHHREAARHMAERVAELYPQPEVELPRPEDVDNGEDLLRFARELSRFQRYSKPS